MPNLKWNHQGLDVFKINQVNNLKKKKAILGVPIQHAPINNWHVVDMPPGQGNVNAAGGGNGINLAFDWAPVHPPVKPIEIGILPQPLEINFDDMPPPPPPKPDYSQVVNELLEIIESTPVEEIPSTLLKAYEYIKQLENGDNFNWDDGHQAGYEIGHKDGYAACKADFDLE